MARRDSSKCASAIERGVVDACRRRRAVRHRVVGGGMARSPEPRPSGALTPLAGHGAGTPRPRLSSTVRGAGGVELPVPGSGTAPANLPRATAPDSAHERRLASPPRAAPPGTESGAY